MWHGTVIVTYSSSSEPEEKMMVGLILGISKYYKGALLSEFWRLTEVGSYIILSPWLVCEADQCITLFFLEWSHWPIPYTTANPIWSQVPYSTNLGLCLGILVMACAWDDLTLVWVACCFSVADSCGCYLMDSQMALSFPELWFVFQSQVPFSFDSVLMLNGFISIWQQTTSETWGAHPCKWILFNLVSM